MIRYSSENYLIDILTRNKLVAKNNKGLSTILNNNLAKQKEIPFMAIDFENLLKKIGEKNCYILHLYDFLING